MAINGALANTGKILATGKTTCLEVIINLNSFTYLNIEYEIETEGNFYSFLESFVLKSWVMSV